MRIKVATFSLLFIDLILFITAGFSLATIPGRAATKAERVQFVVRSYLIVAVLLISLLATVLIVWIWMKNLREQYREEAKKNLQDLIEGTLRDHEQKQS